MEKQSTLMECPVDGLHWQMGEGGSQVFPGSVPKGPSEFLDVFLLTTYQGAFEPVY